MILDLKKYEYKNYKDEEKRKVYLREYGKKYSTEYYTQKMRESRVRRRKRKIEYMRGDIHKNIEKTFDSSDFEYIQSLATIPEATQKIYFPKMTK